MTQDEVIRHPGVYRRSDSAIWQFGLRAPADLSAHFLTGWAVRCSLKTADLRAANEEARRLQAEWGARFEALRQARPAPVDLRALRAHLLARVESSLAALDASAALLAPEERARRLSSAEWDRQDALQELADGRIPDWAEKTLDKWGYERSRLADAEALPFLVLLAELRCEALRDVSRTFPLRVQRLKERRALVDATPAPMQPDAPTPAPQPPAGRARRMRDAFQAWHEAAPRPEKTVGQFSRHVALFEELAADVPLASLRRPDAIRFRDALQAWAIKEGKTARTADNVLVSIKALATIARDREWIEGDNPFARLTVAAGGKESEGREPWTVAELVRLFDDPIWTAYQLPEHPKAGADAAYWLPLMACFTGARISELAQLWTDDLSIDAGAEVIEFRANTERGQSLKTKGSRRAVPMHSELLRLGLADYVRSLPIGPLFPKLPTAGQNGAGGQFGKWFGEFKAGKGFGPTKTFHSLRHNVGTELRMAGAHEALADAITGHAGGGVARTVYAATIRRDAERLRPTMELLRYPGLSLPRVFDAQRFASTHSAGGRARREAREGP